MSVFDEVSLREQKDQLVMKFKEMRIEQDILQKKIASIKFEQEQQPKPRPYPKSLYQKLKSKFVASSKQTNKLEIPSLADEPEDQYEPILNNLVQEALNKVEEITQ